MASANVFESSPHFGEGKFIVRIKEVKQVEGSSDNYIAIETELLASKAVGPDSPAVGMEPAHVFKYPGQNNMGVSTWMQFLCSTLNTEPEAQTDDEWAELSEKITEDNALEGETLELHCHTIITKAGNEFTKHVWKGEPDAETLKTYSL